MMGPHRNLIVWQTSMTLVDYVYAATRNFPREELFGLTSQLRRAATSIPSNIAEGYGRSSNAEVIHFLYNSLGSSNEIDTQLEIALRQQYVTDEAYNQIDTLNTEVNKMLRALIYSRGQK